MRNPRYSFVCLFVLLLGFGGASHAQYAISAFAGGGPNGFATTSSSIGYPGSVARDGLGNTYIADSYSNRILRVDSLGILTVTSTQLNFPAGVFGDGSGNLFIADTSDSKIREVVEAGCGGSSGSSGGQSGQTPHTYSVQVQ